VPSWKLHDKTPGANVAAELLSKQVFDVGFVIDDENVSAQRSLRLPIARCFDEALSLRLGTRARAFDDPTPCKLAPGELLYPTRQLH
jgi:hypothetical protein